MFHCPQEQNISARATLLSTSASVLSLMHAQGMLTRTAKMLDYGIKPVFVFDGKAPELKRKLLDERGEKCVGRVAWGHGVHGLHGCSRLRAEVIG